MRDDFRQIAYLTTLEEEPKYDPQHPSGASFITFMKSRVCGQLWSERRKELKYFKDCSSRDIAKQLRVSEGV